MRFKDGIQQKHAWQIHGKKTLRLVVRILDCLTELFFDRDITVTSAIRKPRTGKPSFHPIGQAIDFRTKGLPDGVIQLWITTLVWLRKLWPIKKDLKGKLDWELEDKGKDNEHLHLEWDTGDPV